MKIGMRKPSLKKSIKARTTGRFKRAVKKSINPLYGKKGMGFIKNPSRSIKNSIYHKTTFGVSDILNAAGNNKNNTSREIKTSAQNPQIIAELLPKMKWWQVLLCIVLFPFSLFWIAARNAENKKRKSRAISAWNKQERQRLERIAHVVFEIPRDVEIPKQLSNQQIDDAAKMFVDRRIQIISDCVRIVNETKTPSVFFERFETLLRMSQSLVEIEDDFQFKRPLPSEQQQGLVNTKEAAVDAMILRTYKAVKESCESLKTEKGKINRIEKFFEIMYSYEDKMTERNLKTLKELKSKEQIF